jgi:hypothetical protein
VLKSSLDPKASCSCFQKAEVNMDPRSDTIIFGTPCLLTIS